MFYMVLVNGLFFTGQSTLIGGANLPLLNRDMKYGKLFQTRTGAVEAYNRIGKVMDEVIEIHEVRVELNGLVKSNEYDVDCVLV